MAFVLVFQKPGVVVRKGIVYEVQVDVEVFF